MAISVVGTPASSTTTTVTVPAHAIGDYIIIVAMRSATTAPTLPAGYTSIVTGTGNSNSYRVGYKVATATNDTSGTWTNASLLLCSVYTGVGGIGVSSAATKVAATTATIPALTLNRTDSTSWVLAFAGHAATSTQGTPLAGATTSRVTQTSGTYNAGLFDTGAGVSSFSATTSSNTTSVVSSGGSIELMANNSFSTLTEPFNTGVQDTKLWGGNFGTLSWAPAWTITNPVSYTGYGGMNTLATYDLTGTAVSANITNIGNQALVSLEVIPVQVNDLGGTNKLFWYINQNSVTAYKTVGGTQTSVSSASYSSLSSPTWFRIRESAGTTFWDYSSNGSSWTNFTSASNPITVTSLLLQPSFGTFSAEASSTTGVWASFNASSAVNATIAQVAATVTAAGGTQAVSTVRNVAISQLAATVTATGGTQVVQSRATVAQLAATITAAGGTQAVLSVANAAITQVAATVTATGGTQVALAAFQANISQVAATITATGGTQTVATSRKVALAQLAATVTATGGTQVLASSRFVSLAQLAATVTATGGTQVLAAQRLAQISQVAANILATGGTQSLFLTSVFTYATITLSSGTNSGNDSTGTNIVDVSGSGILDSVNTQINTTNQSGGTKDVTLQTSTNNETLDS